MCPKTNKLFCFICLVMGGNRSAWTQEGNVRQILHEPFNMRKVWAKMLPKLLTPEQKKSRMNICADILNNIDTDPGLLDTMITCYESMEAVKSKATEVLSQLTEADFQQ
ncbi:hypothetical protein NQ318_009234 [Aromia moschata]|uniref:Uncharacterized protein n=1 Tax=Aromia moschata TaxID=1265417 RepID=A0AAV8Y9I0_9CUCU|nr:hypothetical protein NQ318_009234 [Aromia moschata]